MSKRVPLHDHHGPMDEPRDVPPIHPAWIIAALLLLTAMVIVAAVLWGNK